MDNTRAQQKALDDELVAPADRLKIGKSNLRLSSILKSKEPTLQVALDALKLTPFYNTFEISTDVPEIYMQEFWICSRFALHSQVRNLMNLLEEEILSFIRDLRHTGEIQFLSDVNVNHMHQPWRSFSAIINKCLSGKTTALESLRLSCAQILWGMYHNKKFDYVYLLWEDLVFQVENKNSKKNNDMYYPRFTKVIVDYFMTKDQAIPRRNKMFWHYARDDFMFTIVRVISKHEDTQVYGAILPQHLTNQAIKESEAYMTYCAYATDSFDPRVQTPSHVESSDDESNKESDEEVQGANTEEEEMEEEATHEEDEANELYRDETEDTHVILTAPINPKGQQQSSSVSSGFISNMLNHRPDTGINLIFNLNTKATLLIDVLVTTIVEPPLVSATTLPPPPTPLITHMQQTPVPTPTTFKKTNQFAKAVSSIPGIVDAYLANKMNDAIKTAVQLQSDRLRDEAQAQVSKILPKIEKTVNEQLEAKVITHLSTESKTSLAIAANLSDLELKKILIEKIENNKSINISNEQKNLYKALVEAYESDKLILDTYGDTVAFKRRRDDEDKDEETSARSN
ncbi:hypothetical protein Tco_0888262 [Tanacetum coccineum]